MKVGELREKLSKMTVEEITKLTVEFYKLVPKAKKEDFKIDELINNPKKKKAKKKVPQMDIYDVEFEVSEFIADARDMNYIRPNRIVSKKDRANWRFKVKKWYKELLNTKREEQDLEFQADTLVKLYKLLCESCAYTYFSAYDTFESIGITQVDFFKSILILLIEAKGKKSIIDEGINLVVNNELNRYTLYSELMVVFISFLNIPDLKLQAITKINSILKTINSKQSTSKSYHSNNGHYKIERKNNNLAEFAFRIYASLGEYDEGIKFFKKEYYHSQAEVKLYVLIEMLFNENKKDLIKREFETAIKKGIQLREELVKLHQQIIEKDCLPNYF